MVDRDAQIARIQALADKWLKPLGLLWWRRITFGYSEDRRDFGVDSDEAVMITHPSWEYMEAVIDVNLLYVAELDDPELEYDFVHELVHILLAEITNRKRGSVERVVTNVASAFLWVEQFLGKAGNYGKNGDANQEGDRDRESPQQERDEGQEQGQVPGLRSQVSDECDRVTS